MDLLQDLTTATLRSRARGLGWKIRFFQHWNGVDGKRGFVVYNANHNSVASELLDEEELREWLITAIADRRDGGG